jgi:hypothetical protein
METVDPRLGHPLWARTWDLAAPVVVWAIWGIMTAAAILWIQRHARNIPYMDDFCLVSVMTEQEPVSLRWIWSQHNEHRPVISRLIQAGLFRFVAKDFRAGIYVNAGLLSAAAASMLLVARRVRGSTGITDAILPLSILTPGQAETLLLSFAMPLVLSTWIAIELIATVDSAGRRPGWWLALRWGLFLVLLPLCGGSGLVMLPPLVVWLAGYVAWGWWSGREPSGLARAIGLGFLMACSAVVGLYLGGYTRPAQHPPAPSLAAVIFTTFQYLSLIVCPNLPGYWWPASLTVVMLLIATLLRLTVVGLRAPGERSRAFGLIAIILSMICVAIAVGLSRSGLGPECGLASRYVTTAAPLLGALYIAWLVYGPASARWMVHVGLLALVCLSVPANTEYSQRLGEQRRLLYFQLERSLKSRVPASQLIGQVCPALLPDRDCTYECFKLLKAARIGRFKYFIDDRVAAAAAVEDPAARH